ncbi:antiterminator Q family protein [Klebsiella pneumoniae]
MQRDIQLVLERWGTWAISESSQCEGKEFRPQAHAFHG